MQNSVQNHYVLLIFCILITSLAVFANAQQIPGSALQKGQQSVSGVFNGFTISDQTSPIVVPKITEFELNGLDTEENYISLRAFNHSDKIIKSFEEISILNGELTSIESREEVTFSYDLHQNYPNPFNPSTQIQYSVKYAGDVHLAVYNMLGQQVSVLINEYKPAGMHEATFDASHLSSGVYLYRIQAGNFVRTRNLTLIK
ncbi:MAG: T9SS type A sorting domain-containing protein [Balneolales bacterium]